MPVKYRFTPIKQPLCGMCQNQMENCPENGCRANQLFKKVLEGYMRYEEIVTIEDEKMTCDYCQKEFEGASHSTTYNTCSEECLALMILERQKGARLD